MQAALTALRQGLDSVSQERSGEGPPIRVGSASDRSTRIIRAPSALPEREDRRTHQIVTG